MAGAFQDGMSHSPRNCLESFVSGTLHHVDGFEGELFDGETSLIFGVGDGLLDGFVHREGGGFASKLEVEERLFGTKRAHGIGYKTKLAGTGADIALYSFHKIMFWLVCV